MKALPLPFIWTGFLPGYGLLNPLRLLYLIFRIGKNMGARYLVFRAIYEIRRRTGILKRQFPTTYSQFDYPPLDYWKKHPHPWLWQDRENITIEKKQSRLLEEKAKDLLAGKYLLFQAIPYKFVNLDDWVKNPKTGFTYDVQKHWTEIPDLSPEAGDIKYVWERSRFTQIHTLLRYDYHFGQDMAGPVFQEIESWIKANPLNCGPNFRCSQEISLRVFNWLGALAYYRFHPELTEKRWHIILESITGQMEHVWTNIHFSRIAVRNNHAITETLALYVFCSLFPQFPFASKWKAMGKKWFEEEITYQVYPDGSYLQFSMNYHRVVVQLLTLAIRFAEIQGENFSSVIYDRAVKSLQFLRFFQDSQSGFLPNYGANDGALFFQFTDKPFRDYTDQLAALEAALYGNTEQNKANENAAWFGFSKKKIAESPNSLSGLMAFPDGGFAGIKEEKTITFFRCGRHKDRPSQADNLHVDIWHEGKNLFRDGGSYQYNATEAEMSYFFGSQSHNVLMINGMDQMKKGPRFIFTHWSQAKRLKTWETNDAWFLEGEIQAFGHIQSGISHKRLIKKFKNKPFWEVEDQIYGIDNQLFELLWHPNPELKTDGLIRVFTLEGSEVKPMEKLGWYSGLYGVKEEAPYLVYSQNHSYFKTIISLS